MGYKNAVPVKHFGTVAESSQSGQSMPATTARPAATQPRRGSLRRPPGKSSSKSPSRAGNARPRRNIKRRQEGRRRWGVGFQRRAFLFFFLLRRRCEQAIAKPV